MDNRDIREALGLDPNKHLPKEGMGPVMIGNVEVFIVPKVSSRRIHRVMCICPVCKNTMSAGRLAQHMLAHTKERRVYK